MRCFVFFAIQKSRGKNLTLPENKSRLRIIIYITSNGLKSLLLSIKFQGHLTYGSREEIFSVYGHGCHLRKVAMINYIQFCSREA